MRERQGDLVIRRIEDGEIRHPDLALLDHDCVSRATFQEKSLVAVGQPSPPLACL